MRTGKSCMETQAVHFLFSSQTSPIIYSWFGTGKCFLILIVNTICAPRWKRQRGTRELSFHFPLINAYKRNYWYFFNISKKCSTCVQNRMFPYLSVSVRIEDSSAKRDSGTSWDWSMSFSPILLSAKSWFGLLSAHSLDSILVVVISGSALKMFDCCWSVPATLF